MEGYFADIIIIGGGASGLMAAAYAARTLSEAQLEGKVTILEKMPRPGRKIMITGKGRCNYTNLKDWNEFSPHIHPKPNFLKPSFYNLTSARLMDFFQDNGMDSVVERGDRVFPASHLASDVVDALAGAAERAGAEILCSKEVISVEKDETSGTFMISCSDSSIYHCRKLIVCTGGLSYPKTGSTGDGYGWARSMGHTVRPLFPSLTAIVPERYKDIDRSYLSPLGMKCHIDRNVPLSETGRLLCGNQLKNVSLRIFIDGNLAAEEFGDLDFTDGGLEGPIGFKVSRKCVNALTNGSKVGAEIDLKPAVGTDELSARISALWDEICKDRRSLNKNYKEKFRILCGRLLPAQLVQAFIRLNPDVDHKTAARCLKGWKMNISGYVGYERCVVTAGGVHLDEVNPRTLESRLVPGLHFAGEMLDLDGDTGGYNLQTAFSTGCLAGQSAALILKKETNTL